jgi:hypothetical protein
MSVTREMCAAGPGCAAANGLLNAFEVTKVKLQLHNHNHSVGVAQTPVYRNPTTIGVMKQIATEEGMVRGLLTPGISASLTRSMLYGAYRVGLYSTTRDWMSSSSQTPTLQHRMASGMMTGGLGSMLSCPLDVVRTRLQADAGLICNNGIYTTGLRTGLPVRYTGMVSALVHIWKEEGLRHGLYRGASVTVARASLLNGAQLASYDTLKKYLGWHEGPVLHSFCALMSGIIAQTLIMPIDTFKSHMMLGKPLATVVTELRTQRGPPFYGLYRGYLAASAGQGLIMVLQMPLIEEFRRLLGVAAI